MQINKIKWKTSVVLHALYESSHCLLPHMQILYLYENKRGVHLLITQYARYASEKQSISSSATYFLHAQWFSIGMVNFRRNKS